MVAFDSEYFFGRTCGFQVRETKLIFDCSIDFCFHLFKFAPSMQTMLTFLLAGLATFHETYNRSIPYAAASLATAPKYILFPEQRAKKVYSFIHFLFESKFFFQ
jgi:hypothetical protein